MKFDFWFDLPKALADIGQETLTKEDIECCCIIDKSLQEFNSVFSAINQNFEQNADKFSSEELEKINLKLLYIKKEKVDLMCKSIKLSTKLMSRMISALENYENMNLPDGDLLVKIKLFLKITRLVVENAKATVADCQTEKEKEFFTMIYTFSEKVQNKLFTASNAIIKSTLQKKIGENKRDRKSGLCKMQEADLHCVVDKTGYVKQNLTSMIPATENEGSGESNMILTELKEEDMKNFRIEDEIKNMYHYEDRIYDIKFHNFLEFPESLRSSQESVECFSIRFDKFDNQIAGGFSNGYVCVFDVNGKVKSMKASDYPVTCVRWKPHFETKPKNILLTVTADGKITHWHTSTGKSLYTMEEKDNPLMCVDYSADGQLFATGGSDKLVRLYDDNTKTLLGVMKQTNFNNPGHSNRVFAINFHKENANLMASGGWDNTIQFYDIRQEAIVNSIYGPHICGDAIDMKGDYLLTGSWSIKDQIQLWDLRTLKLIENLPWDKDQYFNSTYIYTAQFSKSSGKNQLYGVGGSNNNLCRVFENETAARSPQITTKYMSHACYSVDFSNNGKMFAYGCGDGTIRIFNIEKVSEQ